MNPGSSFIRPARYDRPALSLMSPSDVQQWNAKDAVLHGATHIRLLSLAEQAGQHVQQIDAEAITVCRANKTARKNLQRKAERWVRRQLEKIESAVAAQQWRRLADLIDTFFRRYEAKYVAYVEARKKLKRKYRPHLYALQQCAQELDLFSLEFEEARLRFERKSGRSTESRKPEDYRPITSFDIHHRARQQLVSIVLKACFPNHCRADQYGVVGRGRDEAIEAVEHAFLDPEIEFVCEADIENFYATIGEEDGCITPENALYRELSILPRAVLDSTVLSRLILVSLPDQAGLQTLSRDFDIRTGLPQGSAVSAFIAELVSNSIMTNTERLTLSGCDMIGYIDNFAILGRTRDDVHLQKNALSVCASTNPFGSFRLKNKSVRHKSQGFVFLGYFLRYVEEGQSRRVEIDISIASRNRLADRIRSELERFRPSSHQLEQHVERKAADISKRVNRWRDAFAKCDDAELIASDILGQVFSEFPRMKRLLRTRVVDLLCEQ